MAQNIQALNKEQLQQRAAVISSEAKKAHTSVIRKLIILIIIGILLYTAAILSAQYKGLSDNLVIFNEKDLREKSEVLITRIQNMGSDLLFTTRWAAKDISDEGPSLLSNGTAIDSYASDAVKKLGAEHILIITKDGKDASSKEIYSFTVPQDMISKTLSGNETSDLVKSGTQIYVVGGVPVLSNSGEVAGAVFMDKRISTQAFVDEISQELSCKVTIFANYKRLFTSLPGMQGTEIANKSIVDSVLKGDTFNAEATIGRLNYVTYYFPLKNKGGTTLTTLFLGVETSKVLVVASSLLKVLLPIALVLAILYTVLLLF